MMRPRRDSRHPPTFPSAFFDRHRQKQRDDDDDDDVDDVDDHTPLIRPSSVPNSPQHARYGSDLRASSSYSHHHHVRRPSGDTASSRRSPRDRGEDYDVNNPPSIPGSPKSGPDMGYDDAVITGADFDFGTPQSPKSGRRESTVHDAVIQIDADGGERTATAKAKRRSSQAADSEPPSPFPPEEEEEEEETPGRHRRRRTLTRPEEDVCFPAELVAEQFGPRTSRGDESGERRRRRRREWPDLAVLEEWSREEKEERSGELRAKKISEPVLVGGRLRPQYAGWRREEDEAPYRFTYFNEEFQSTIHAQTISELVQPGGSFRELFIPDPPELADSETDGDSSEETNNTGGVLSPVRNEVSQAGNIRHHDPGIHRENSTSGSNTTGSRKGGRNPSRSDSRFSNESPSHRPQEKPKRYGPRPVWWLDVLSPTDAEMRVMAKAFGIHALTAEDIMMQEAREKVELFRNYYFLNYRTFEQDSHSENYLQPVNMYVVVFREGVLTFHFSQTPHPANVRRRIRQLRDYLLLSADWISYALIDDITDVFGPLIQSIEDEVDDIDDTIMQMHTAEKEKEKERGGDRDNIPAPLAPGDMLRRVGECRKKVMGMYRLLSNKADVIKGFAKRCNEQWEVAPKSEIGLYLGDIQDHIMTMTSNLTHYETCVPPSLSFIYICWDIILT